MKGLLHKTEQGWIVIYDEIIGENLVKKNQNSLPLVDNGHIDGLKLYDSNEGLEVDFEIFIGYDNNGPEHFPKFARILTPEESELKDWDVTLNDGLENEPYVSDDFQIGPDGAYEHIEENKTMTPKEKAKELFDKYADEFNFDDTYRGYREQSKQCALVVVDEIIKECYNWNGSDNVQWETKRFNYWNDVKQEIKNL